MIAISVIVPCRNEARSLAACLDALLDQDFPREGYEILVVDGGSVDGCAPIARSRGVRTLVDTGDGPAGARNVGIREARGEIVAFTDADCVPARDWLTRIAEAFAEDPGVAGVAGSLRLPRATLVGRMEDMDAQAHYEGYITSNVAYLRDAVLAVGGFDERLCCAEDYDLAWRILESGHRIAHEPRAVVLHDPPEIHGSVARYLAKQFWYARHDIPALALAIRRSPEAWSHARSSAAGLAWTVAVASWPLAPHVGALALAGVAGVSTLDVARAARRSGSSLRELPSMAAIAVAKKLARGAGTAVGIVDLAREGGALRSRASTSRARERAVVERLRSRARAG